jgi:hypothetical protein
MLYVTHISTVVTRSRRGLGTHIRSRTVARVSTRPFDHSAPKRSFSPQAWADLMQRPDVMYRPNSRSRYLRGEHPPTLHR